MRGAPIYLFRINAGRALFIACLLAAWPGFFARAGESAVSNSSGEMLAGLADRPFEVITTRQGLPDDALYAVTQDSLGFLWVGTRQGLARFDGFRMRTYAHDPDKPSSLPDDNVRALLPDRDGSVWVGTSKSGLVRYDPATDDFRRPAGEPAELAGGLVFSLAPDGTGGVWCGFKSGLAHYKPDGQGTWETFRRGDASGFPFGQAYSAIADRQGNLWVGGDEGVTVRRAGAATFVPVPGEPEAQALAKQHIWALFEDGKGRIWVGSDGDGAGWIEPATGRLHAVSGLTGPDSLIGSSTVRGFLEPTPGEIWIPTFGSGLVTANLATGARRRWTNDVSLQSPISNDYVRSLWQTRSGRVFLATDRGLDSTDPTADAILSLHPSPYRKTGLTGKSVFSVMATPSDDIWVGYGDGGIELIGSTGQVRRVRPDPAYSADLMPHRQIQAIEKSPDGTIVASADGLYVIDPASFTVRPLGRKGVLRESWTPTLLLRPEGLWAGTYDGLVRVDPHSGRELAHYHHGADPASLPDELITKILPAADGHLWIATRNGLCHFNQESQSCRTYRNDPGDPTSLSVDNINAMVMDDQGRLWLSTQGGGIDVMEVPPSDDGAEKPRFRRVDRKEGLPADSVGVMVKGADGRIWMNPPAGLTAVDPATLQATLFPVGEGLWLGGSFLKGSTVMSDGTLLFPAEDGIVVVRPDRLQSRNRPVQLVLSEVTIDRRRSLTVGSLSDGQPIVLVPGESSFHAEFALLDMSSPTTTRYAFQLEGFDRERIDASSEQRSATYTGLPPGRYVLHVWAVADGGRGGETTIAVPVEVRPAWYQTLTFHLAVVVLGLAGLIAAERVRTAYLRHRQRTLENQVAERTASLNKAQKDIQTLLDNAEQGFLAFGPDLIVRPQFSAACQAMLGSIPCGRPVLDVLYPDDPERAGTQRSILGSIFKDMDDFTRGLKLELLAKELTSGGRSLQAAYKWLVQSNVVMLVLSDVTETRLLAAAVERERTRIEMIVLAITESREFVGLAEEYRHFLREEAPAMLAQRGDEATHASLLRRMHTYKGLLAQFNFFHSPAALHDAEQLVIEGGPEADAVPAMLEGKLALDLTSVTETLGPDFLIQGGKVALGAEQIAEMTALAEEALAAQPASAALSRLAQTLSCLGALDVKAALTLHSRGALSLAGRLGKELLPVTVSGDPVRLPEETYSAFFRSLIHVFRNAVDHGIETPEERVAEGKPEEGEIACDVAADGDAVLLTIADDGRGIDRDALEQSWVRAGGDPAAAAALSLDDLVFADGLSSRDDASDVSGRGVGMSAVKAELVRLGGTVVLTTEAGRGTRLAFRLPYLKS